MSESIEITNFKIYKIYVGTYTTSLILQNTGFDHNIRPIE